MILGSFPFITEIWKFAFCVGLNSSCALRIRLAYIKSSMKVIEWIFLYFPNFCFCFGWWIGIEELMRQRYKKIEVREKFQISLVVFLFIAGLT